ncbi:hypothetical protein Taro_038916 [Colocasia esculenta]|uniref:Uncharacterized protein n=1 Tax=Colocasia esculenta TaxID=4460 RepID=A0A843WH99_COLES|nr:hypothetical protein [Colocasia esculenta]
MFNSTSWIWVPEHRRYSHPLRFIPTPLAKELGITFRTGIGIAYVTTIRNRHSETVDNALVFKSHSKVRLLSLGRLRSRKTKNPHLHPLKRKATTTVSRSRRRPFLRRVQKGAKRRLIRRIISALRFWVRWRQWRHRYLLSDIRHVAIRFPPQRRSLSRPHTPCVRLERSREGLRKSPLTVDSHTAAGLVRSSLSSLEELSPPFCAHMSNMESYLNPVYDEKQDPALYTSQDYEDSLPHDLFGESTSPWVAVVHTSEGRRHNEGSPSQNIHPPQSDDQATQLLRLIPQLDQSQIQTLMTALKGNATSSTSPRAGASRPAAAASGPHVVMGQADNTPIRPQTIRFTPFESEHYLPRESRPRSPPY